MESTYVAPHVGAWIETSAALTMISSMRTSLPTWERGLKQAIDPESNVTLSVAPHVGAWIETQPTHKAPTSCACRSPRGSVD